MFRNSISKKIFIDLFSILIILLFCSCTYEVNKNYELYKTDYVAASQSIIIQTKSDIEQLSEIDKYINTNTSEKINTNANLNANENTNQKTNTSTNKNVLDIQKTFNGVGRQPIKYNVSQDLSNVENQYKFEFGSEEKLKLSQNGFIVENSNNTKFYEVYYENNKTEIPNFITVDAISHIVNQYISYFKIKIEKEYLSNYLLKLTSEMLDESKIQYEALKGSDWESAAKRNVAYFTVALSLQENCIVEEYVAPEVEIELALIEEGKESIPSSLFSIPEDYSALKPQGIYETNEVLSKYYRALKWYQIMNIPQDDEDYIKSAFLISFAEKNISSNYYNMIFDINSFLYGWKDGITNIDYKKIINEIYDNNINVDFREESNKKESFGQIKTKSKNEDIIKNNIEIVDDTYTEYENIIIDKESYEQFLQKKELVDTKKHSYILYDKLNKEDTSDDSKESDINEISIFKFLPEPFSIDDYIFQTLSSEEKSDRNLPDIMDIISVFGSKVAEKILDTKPARIFKYYFSDMYLLRENYFETNEDGDFVYNWLKTIVSTISEIVDNKTVNKLDDIENIDYIEDIDTERFLSEDIVYCFLKALRPLIYEKPYTAPQFMKSEEWQKKNIETFSASYVELKSKPSISENGLVSLPKTYTLQGSNEDIGFVEPESFVYRRFFELAKAIKEITEKFNLTNDDETNDLIKLIQILRDVYNISEKELANEKLSNSEIKLIKNFENEIIYFDELSSNYLMSINEEQTGYTNEYTYGDSKIVTLARSKSIETSLQASVGTINNVYAIVLINGKLKIVKGPTYSFYELKVPIDSEVDEKNWIKYVREKKDLHIATISSISEEEIIIKKDDWTKTYTYEK